MNIEVKQCIIDTIYENSYLTRAEYDEIMSQISDDYIISDGDIFDDIRNIEIQFDEYYADIDIIDVAEIYATLQINQYDGYLMCEVKITCESTGDVIYKEVTLEGDAEECFA